MKLFVAALLAIGFLYYVLVNYSQSTTIYDCKGQPDSPAILFVQLDRYRPWVALWNDAYGTLLVEQDTGWSHFFSPLTVSGQMIQIYRFGVGSEQVGEFSLLSGKMAIQLNGQRVEVTCEDRN